MAQSRSNKPRNSNSRNKAHNEPAPTAPEPDLIRAVDLVMRLMEIPGRSGEEATVARFITDRLLAAGAEAAWIRSDTAHRRTPIAGNTGNLILSLPGTIRGPRRLLTSHMDTVPICLGSRPKQSNGFVRSADPKTGCGADDRAGVATTLTAAVEILERKLPHPPLTFCWFVQEEIGLYGARNVTKGMLGKPPLAFNWDGGAPTRLTIGATGGYRLKIDIQGLASHAGGAPEMGVSAIAIASLAIADLHRGGWHGAVEQGRRRGTSNVGFIHGGEATNVVTDHVAIKAEARSHDPTFRKRIVAEIEKCFTQAAKEVQNKVGVSGSVTFDGRLDYESFVLPEDDPSLLHAEAALRALGCQPERAISNGGVDANWLMLHGIPTVTLGCGQVSPHTVEEALHLDGFRCACRVALRLATGCDSVAG